MSARNEKARAVEELAQKLSGAKGAILTDFKGLDVKRISLLRRSLRGKGIEYRVVKNTLTRRAAETSGIAGLDEFLKGPTALAFAYEDPIAAAKSIVEFSDENKELTIKAGLIEGQLMNAKDVRAIAKLPSKPVLLGMVAGGIAVPLSMMAYALRAPLSGFAYALSALARSRELPAD